MISNVGVTQRCLKRPRLDICAKKDCLLRPANLFRMPRKFNLFDDAGCLFVFSGKRFQNNFWSSAFTGPELLGATTHVVSDESIGCCQNRIGGPVVLLELNYFNLWKMLFEIEQVGDFSAAPAVN